MDEEIVSSGPIGPHGFQKEKNIPRPVPLSQAVAEMAEAFRRDPSKCEAEFLRHGTASGSLHKGTWGWQRRNVNYIRNAEKWFEVPA